MQINRGAKLVVKVGHTFCKLFLKPLELLYFLSRYVCICMYSKNRPLILDVHNLKEGHCTLFFRPRTRPKTFVQYFALERRKYKKSLQKCPRTKK